MRCTGLNSWKSWILSVISAIVYCLLVTVYRLGGLFFVAVIEYYEVGREEAAIPFTVLATARCLSGFLFGVLAQRFGLRKIAFLGCFSAVIGVFSSVFAKDILALSFTLGLYGAGMSTTALLACIIRGHFDESAITTSNGVLNLGPCVCALVFSPIIIHLLDVYGLPSTMMLTTGFVLNSIPLMIILKEAKSKTVKCKSITVHRKEIHDSSALKENYSQNSNFQENTAKESSVYSTKVLNTVSKVSHENTDFFNKRRSDIVTVTSSYIEMKVSKCLRHKKEKCRCVTDIIAVNNHYSNLTTPSNDLMNLSNNLHTLTSKDCTNRTYHLSNEAEHLNLKENVALNKQSLSKTLEDASDQNIQSPTTDSQQQIDSSIVSSVKTNDEEHTKQKTFCSSLNALADLAFVTLLVVQGIFAYTFNVFLTTIIDYSRDKGIHQSHEVYILILVPVADITGRLAFTWVTDKNYLSFSSFGMILHIVMGISCTWMALSNDFIMFTVGAMMLSIGQGVMLNIYPGMTYANIEKDKQILSISSIGVLYAPLSFTVSPFIGYFRGSLGSYNGLYYLLTASNLVAGLLVLLLPSIKKARKRKKERSKKDTL